MDYTETARVH